MYIIINEENHVPVTYAKSIDDHKIYKEIKLIIIRGTGRVFSIASTFQKPQELVQREEGALVWEDIPCLGDIL